MQQRGVGRLVEEILLVGQGVEKGMDDAADAAVADEQNVFCQAALAQLIQKRIDTSGDVHVRFTVGVASGKEPLVGEKIGVKAAFTLEDAVILLDQAGLDGDGEMAKLGNKGCGMAGSGERRAKNGGDILIDGELRHFFGLCDADVGQRDVGQTADAISTFQVVCP